MAFLAYRVVLSDEEVGAIVAAHLKSEGVNVPEWVGEHDTLRVDDMSVDEKTGNRVLVVEWWQADG